MIETTVATDLLGKTVSIYEQSSWASGKNDYYFKGSGVVRAVFVKDTDIWLVVSIRSDSGHDYGYASEKKHHIDPLRDGKPFSFLSYASMTQQTIVVEDP